MKNELKAGTAADSSTTDEVTTSASLAQNPLLAAALSTEEGNKLIADFDDNLKYKPVKAGYGEGGSFTSIARLFNTFQECFEFCDARNYGLHPDECFFALPDTDRFKLKYHSSWDRLIPVVEQIMMLHWNDRNNFFDVSLNHFIENDIEAVWTRVVKFLHWYNENRGVSRR